MMDGHQTYCGNHFMMDVSQINVLYTLNLYNPVCQLYLNKTGRKYYIRGNKIIISGHLEKP